MTLWGRTTLLAVSRCSKNRSGSAPRRWGEYTSKCFFRPSLASLAPGKPANLPSSSYWNKPFRFGNFPGCGSVRCTTLRSGCYLLYVNGLLCRIEFARQHHMRSRKVPNGFRVVDNPDSLIIVSHKNGPLGFPFGVPHRSTPTPAFLHTIRAARLRVFGSATLITDPTGAGCVRLLT